MTLTQAIEHGIKSNAVRMGFGDGCPRRNPNVVVIERVASMAAALRRRDPFHTEFSYQTWIAREDRAWTHATAEQIGEVSK